jgi:restriction system protein
VLFGQHHAAATWREVLVGVCTVLAQRHGAAFGPTAAAVKGRRRQYIAASPTGIIMPAKIPGAELWVETNQSAKSVMQVLGRLLVALGHPPEELTIALHGKPRPSSYRTMCKL